MKNTLFISSILSIFLFLNCIPKDPATSLTKDTICLNYAGDPVPQLPVGLVIDMREQYVENQLATIERELMPEDAEAIWFDLETLKKFIYHLEHTTQSNDSTISSKDLGVRIYYASYPDKKNWKIARYNKSLDVFMGDPITEQYEKKHTLVMIPTIKKGAIDMDYDPLNVNTYKNGLNGVQDEKDQLFYQNPKNKIFSLSSLPMKSVSSGSTGSSSVGAQNHGSLFPPKGNGGFGF